MPAKIAVISLKMVKVKKKDCLILDFKSFYILNLYDMSFHMSEKLLDTQTYKVYGASG